MKNWYLVYAHVFVLYKSKAVKVVQTTQSVLHFGVSEAHKFKFYARGASAYLSRIQMIGELKLSQLHLYTMHYFRLILERTIISYRWHSLRLTGAHRVLYNVRKY